MANIKILVAEDDANIRMGLVDTLESEGYDVVEAENGLQAQSLFDSSGFDLLLLDIMMPEKSGYDLCRDIRKTDEQIPIILLTAKGEEIDKVVGLNLGADDYITKPFGVHELLARIAALLRRCAVGKQPSEKKDNDNAPFKFGPFEVNPKKFKLTKENISWDISERELVLMEFFSRHPGEVLSRDSLLNAGWGIDYSGTTRTLDQHIAQLRKKVETDPSSPCLITTVHGIGYRYTGQP